MKLSEILAAEAAGKDPIQQVYKVEVDLASAAPPKGLKEIGFLYKEVDDEMDIDLLDTMISYRGANVAVILEIPAEYKNISAPYLVSLAQNTEFDISLLPPINPTEQDKADYIATVAAFTDAYFLYQNLRNFIYPVTSYLNYMFVEVVRDASDFKATDPYIISTFVDTTTEEFSDAMKAKIRERIHNHFGGAEKFRAFAITMFRGIYAQVNEFVQHNLGLKKPKTDQYQSQQNDDDDGRVWEGEDPEAMVADQNGIAPLAAPPATPMAIAPEPVTEQPVALPAAPAAVPAKAKKPHASSAKKAAAEKPQSTKAKTASRSRKPKTVA